MTVHVREFTTARQIRGARACLSGSLAEDQVAQHYRRAGCAVLAQRWRSAAGEIDLIAQQGDCTVFVEVKASKTHALAAQRLDRRQMDRIAMAAQIYCGDLPAGLLSEMRFDVALVDAQGRIEIIENAFGEF